MKPLFVPFLTILLSCVVTATDTASTCGVLAYFLGTKVSFPADATYISESASYWSTQESNLKPACRVTPSDADDVSSAIQLLVSQNTEFAVKSGGHMQWAGAANIEGGVTIDLSALNQVTVTNALLVDGTETKHGTVVNLGPGAKWGDVYTKLDPMTLVVPGARIAGAGVGGFLTGGGVSFFAAQAGFSCDNVIQYEVVLANGTIITAATNRNKDLFMALKGGNNNFGIVTQFTMEAMNVGGLWGGTVIYDADEAGKTETELLDAMYSFGEAAGNGEDVHSSVIQSHCTLTSSNTTNLINFYVNTANVANPAILSNFTCVPASGLDTRASSRTLQSLVTELGAFPNNGHRELMAVVAFKNDLEMIKMTPLIHNKVFIEGPLAKINGIEVCSNLQPIHKGILQASWNAGGNSLGLSPSDENLVMANIAIIWDDATADAAVTSAAEDWVALMNNWAEFLGVSHPFIYLNYAMPRTQDPIASYGAASQAVLRAASLKYDPGQIFQKLVPGGFKLWA